MVTSRARELGLSGDGPRKPGGLVREGAKGNGRIFGACSGFPQGGEAAVTLVMAWGKMHLHGCCSGLPLQPVPVEFKLN